MAVRRIESARENMIDQNFQSFGTPWERSSKGLWEEGRDDRESIHVTRLLMGERTSGREARRMGRKVGSKERLLEREAAVWASRRRWCSHW